MSLPTCPPCGSRDNDDDHLSILAKARISEINQNARYQTCVCSYQGLQCHLLLLENAVSFYLAFSTFPLSMGYYFLLPYPGSRLPPPLERHPCESRESEGWVIPFIHLHEKEKIELGLSSPSNYF